MFSAHRRFDVIARRRRTVLARRLSCLVLVPSRRANLADGRRVEMVCSGTARRHARSGSDVCSVAEGGVGSGTRFGATLKIAVDKI